MKQVSELTVKQLTLEMKERSSKQLVKDDLFMTAVAAIYRTREDRLRPQDKSIKGILKNLDWTDCDILSLARCSIDIRDENENEEN